MHETTPFAALRARHGLVPVYLDQGAAGHDKRKCTELLCDPLTAVPMRESVGTLRVAHDWVSSTPPLRGKDDDGTYRTRGAEVYTPELCERLAGAVLQSAAGGVTAKTMDTQSTNAQSSLSKNNAAEAAVDMTKDPDAIKAAL